jgi:hypothetical protein
MLTVAEVLQTAQGVAPDGTVRDLSEQREEPLPQEPWHRDRRTTTIDVPKVLVEFAGKAKATVTFYLDPVDGSRWVADLVVGGKRERTVVVHGTGGVARELERARGAAGLPAPTRAAQPPDLTDAQSWRRSI